MKFYILLFITLLIIPTTVNAQIYTDDQLYAKGYQEIQYNNWQKAMEFLFAFMQRNPVELLRDVKYAAEVKNAYKTASDNMIAAQNSLQTELNNLRRYKENAEKNNTGLGSTSRGVEVRPPLPPMRPPATTVRPWRQGDVKGVDDPIEGEWTITQTSSNGAVSKGKIFIVTSPDFVSGELTLSEQSASFTGIYHGGHLILLIYNGTNSIKIINVVKQDKYQFSGTYKDEGSAGDEGTVGFSRRRQMIENMREKQTTGVPEATEMEVKQVEPRVNRDVQKVKAAERGVKRVER